MRRSSDEVVEQLREAIYSGRIRPGERLPGERRLGEGLGGGRPAPRGALRSPWGGGGGGVGGGGGRGGRGGRGGASSPPTPPASTVGDALAALVNLRGASL